MRKYYEDYELNSWERDMIKEAIAYLRKAANSISEVYGYEQEFTNIMQIMRKLNSLIK